MINTKILKIRKNLDKLITTIGNNKKRTKLVDEIVKIKDLKKILLIEKEF